MQPPSFTGGVTEQIPHGTAQGEPAEARRVGVAHVPHEGGTRWTGGCFHSAKEWVYGLGNRCFKRFYGELL